MRKQLETISKYFSKEKIKGESIRQETEIMKVGAGKHSLDLAESYLVYQAL